MPHRYISVTIPKFITQVPLPNGTVAGAELLVEHDVPDQEGLNIKQSLTNSEMANVSSSAVERRVTIKIEQDVPFYPTAQTGAADWNGNAQYTKGNQVWWKGRVYRAKVDSGLNGALYPNAAHWENTAGDTGLIITLWPKATLATIPEGCWPMDGSTIDAPWSPLHGMITDNINGKVIIGGSKVSGSTYEAGKNSGAESTMLAVSNLPTAGIALSGTSGLTSAGTPTGSISGSTSTNGNHTHTLYSAGSGSGQYIDHDAGGSSTSIQGYGSSIGAAGDHSHSINASFTGTALAAHSHSLSGTVTLNSGAQAGVSTRQPAIHCLTFVRL